MLKHHIRTKILLTDRKREGNRAFKRKKVLLLFRGSISIINRSWVQRRINIRYFKVLNLFYASIYSDAFIKKQYNPTLSVCLCVCTHLTVNQRNFTWQAVHKTKIP